MEINGTIIIYLKKLVGLSLVLTVASCEYEPVRPDSAPVIYISKMVDTAFLNTFYNSETVEVEPCEGVTVTGKVNTSRLGTYYLDHDYTDAFGNRAATVTRTVHVIQNPAEFLNGFYEVVCTCTITQNESPKTTTLTENYTARISSSPLKDHFELVSLKINSEYAIPVSSLHGNDIQIGFYRNTDAKNSGTLSASKQSFTIDTESGGGKPDSKYVCKNSFKKTDLSNEISVIK